MTSPLAFDAYNVKTPDAGPVIYISNDATTWGNLTIALTNVRSDNSDVTIGPDAVLKIYPEMLTPDDIAAIKPGNADWLGGPSSDNRHLELHPKATVTIPSGATANIQLANVLGKAAAQGKFRFFCDALGIRNVVLQGFVQRPPASVPNPWQLTWILDPRVEFQNQGNMIYMTASGGRDIANYLLVHLYHSAGGTLPSKGTPNISYSFLTGDDDLALCSEDQLKSVTAKIDQQSPASRWKEPAKNQQGEDTIWSLSPTEAPGDLFPQDGLVVVRFDQIVSYLPASGSAMLFIHLTGLTDYDDSYIQIAINKVPPVPYVRDFHAEWQGQRVPYNGNVGYGQIALHWDVFAADSCLVGPTGRAQGPLAPTGQGNFASDIKSPTFTLVAHVNGTDYPQPQMIFQMVLPTVSAQAPITMDWSGWDPVYTVTLTWTAFNTASCSISHPQWGFISSALSGTWSKGGFEGVGDMDDFKQFDQPIVIQLTNPAGSATVQVKAQ